MAKMNIKDIESRLMEGSLKVRYHTGVGFMQAYLTEDVRLHVWHPELPPVQEAFGNRHNHRFDLASYILLGKVIDIRFSQLIQNLGIENNWRIYEVMPAHLNQTPIPNLIEHYCNFEIESARQYTQGESYDLPAGKFHQSIAEGLTVTIMQKSNQSEKWARILASRQQIPEHAMFRKPSQILLDQLFFSALRKLPKEANATIERLTTNN